MSRRRLIIGTIVVLLVVGVLSTLLYAHKHQATPDEQNASVSVSGTGQATRLDPSDDDELVQESVQQIVQYNEPGLGGNYSSLVRKSSITRSTTVNGVPKLRYLVDIPELQRTFVVEREGDSSSDYATLYVTCPAMTDLKYPKKPCKQPE